MAVSHSAVLSARSLVQVVQRFEREFAQVHKWVDARGVLSPSQAGNLALRVGADTFVLSSFSGPLAGTAAVVDFRGRLLAGSLDNELHEVLELHAAIFRARPRVQSVLHSHSPYLTAFALAGVALPICYAPLLQNGHTSVPVVPWGPRHAPEPVVRALAEHPLCRAVLLANHGPFVWSEGSIAEVARQLVLLEESARVLLLAQQLGPLRALPEDALSQIESGRVRTACEVRTPVHTMGRPVQETDGVT